jgi:tetratricopeptide (TPR) repeat protein
MKALLLIFLLVSTFGNSEENALLKKAEACFENEDYSHAKEFYQTLLQDYANNEEVSENDFNSWILLRQAHACFLDGKYTDALDLLKEDVLIEDVKATRLLLLGLIYKKLGRFDYALKYLESYLEEAEKQALPHIQFVKNEIEVVLSLLEQPENSHFAIDSHTLNSQSLLKARLARIRAFLKLNTQDGDRKALEAIEEASNSTSSSELQFLQGTAQLQLAQHTRDSSWFEKAKNSWLGILNNKESEEDKSYVILSLKALGALYFQLGEFADAEKIYDQIIEQFPKTPLSGDALFFAGVCAEKQNKEQEVIFNYRSKFLNDFPSSPYAAEAYLHLYPYAEYLHGDPKIIEHLLEMPSKYPNSPFLVVAYYLIGLDAKKDRRTNEGSLIRKGNLNKAIEAFQNAESLCDILLKTRSIPKEQLVDMITLRYRSVIERSIANKTIALASKGVKRQVYLEYAIDVLDDAAKGLEVFNATTNELPHEVYFSLYEEIHLNLAICYRNADKDKEAQKTLDSMLTKYEASNITRGYFLSRTWYEKGIIALKEKDFQRALNDFNAAEDAAKGKVLTTDQRLDLWVQQSYCYRALKQMDTAMLVLSKVVNEDVVSQLRLKGMLLRAEVYEEQERKELAQRQLETLAKKGGDWALIAKEKLEKEYGY